MDNLNEPWSAKHVTNSSTHRSWHTIHSKSLCTAACLQEVVDYRSRGQNPAATATAAAAAAAGLTVEQVGVVRARVAVDLPDVEQVVVLPVHVTTHGEVAITWDVYVYQRRQITKQLSRLQAVNHSIWHLHVHL
jgi:hypothetical protein